MVWRDARAFRKCPVVWHTVGWCRLGARAMSVQCADQAVCCLSGSKSLLSLSRASSGGSNGGSPTALAAAEASEAAETAAPVTPQPAAPLEADVAEGDPATVAGPEASSGHSAPVSPVSSASGSSGVAALPRPAEDADPAAASLAMQRSRSAMFVGSCNLDDAEATVDRGFSSWSAAERESPSCRSSLDVAGIPSGVAGAIAQHEALQEEASAAEELREMLKMHPPQRSRPASRRPSRRTRAEGGDGVDVPTEARSAAALAAERGDSAVASSSAAEGAADTSEPASQAVNVISQREMQAASSGDLPPKARAASLPLPGSRSGSLPPPSRKKGSRTKLDSFDKMLAKTAGGAQEVRLHAPPADRSFLPAWLAAPLRIRRSAAGGGGNGSGNHTEAPSRRSSVSGDAADGPAAPPRRSADWGRLLTPVAEAAQQQQQQQRPPPSAFARRLGRFHSVDEEVAVRAMQAAGTPGLASSGVRQAAVPAARARLRTAHNWLVSLPYLTLT